MNPVVAPARDRAQRMESLANANRIRINRGQLKKQLAGGEADPIQCLQDPPWWLMNMKVEQFLTALPKMGIVKARRLMLDIRISSAKTVGGMSERQRDELCDRLRARP